MTNDDLSEALVDGINSTYGVHPGHRAAHAKGVLCAGNFAPSEGASGLSRAAHFAGAPVQVHVRFSNGGGDPTVADANRDARGIGVKFYLQDGKTTDIVGISLPAFFARTPQDLIAFNAARRPDPETGAPNMDAIGAYIGEHPEVMTAITAAMSHPIPASYGAVTYHALHVFRFLTADGTVRHGRYHIVPDGGDAALDDADAAAQPPDYLREELEKRFAEGAVGFEINVEVAADDDPLDDPTAVWPEGREVVPVGRLELTGLAFDREQDGDVLVFDPTRVTDGIELTDDPILRARSGAYSVSVARRTAT